MLLVYASVQDRPGMAGVSAFLVDPGMPGLRVTSGFEKMGLRISLMGELVLTDCLVPAANRLGPEGARMAIFTPWSGSEAAFSPVLSERCRGSLTPA